jgi:hypothetical protein
VLIKTSDSTRSGGVERKQLRDPPARRDADQVRGREAVGVQHAGRVVVEGGAGVLRPARLVGRRAAGVAMVVADHEAAALGEHPAEALVPPEHRRAGPHDQQQWRIPRVAKGLRAELHAVRFDHPFGQLEPRDLGLPLV